MARLDAEQVDRPDLRLCLVVEALLRQLHPAVREGVVLAMPLDLDLGRVGVDGLDGGPRALLAKANDLGCPPVLPPHVVQNLVVTHILCRVVVGDDARGRRRVPLAHHAAKAFLVEADPVDGPLPCDGHAILGDGKAVGAFGDHARDVERNN